MNKNRPPQLPKRFFQWYCHSRLQETILGDLEEQFDEDIKEYGLKKARRRFIWNVIRFFRPGIIKAFSGDQKLNYYGMMKNDFKAALRVIKREKLYSGINILGLTSGFVIALLILFYVRFEQSYESYNANADKIVRITMDYLDGETLIDQDCETYHNLGSMIKDEFPEVINYTHAFGVDGTIVNIQDNHFYEPLVYAVDPSFLTMFGYPLIHGNVNSALTEPDQAVLTESSAMKYFGRTDVVGEFISFQASSSVKVVGVVNDPPRTTHLKFGLLLSYSSLNEMLAEREDVFDSNDTFTYLELEDALSYETFQSNLATLSDRLRAADHIPDERIISQKIKDIHLYSNKSYEAEQNGSSTLVMFLFGVALMVILIAIVNYINLSTAKSMDRAKEVGIRKVIGSTQGQLRLRFFMESVILNFLAGIGTILIIWFVFDSFKVLAGLPKSLQIFEDATTWKTLTVLLIISTVLSGIFPALILSNLSPISTLKGKFSHSATGILLRKSLVVVQFAIATFLLIQTFTASEQLDFMLNKDLGLDTEKVVVLNVPASGEDFSAYSSFRNSLLQRVDFNSVALSSTVPGLPTTNMGSTTNLKLDEETRELKNNFFIYHTDSNFFNTMDIELLVGDQFTAQSNVKYPIIINEKALRVWGVAKAEDVILKKSSFWGRENTIVGVVKDFHQIGVKSAHLPMIFTYIPNAADYISVKLGTGNVFEQLEELEKIYISHFPNSPFESFFLDQNFDAQYRSDRQFQQVFAILSSFAILITCLGLFGLASFTVAKRAKEIGIRKVLGAEVSQIVALLSRDFVILVTIASGVAIPVAYYLVQNWLNQYSFQIEMNIWLFLGPAFLIFIIAFVTVFSKTYQFSNMDPVKALRDE